MRQPERSGQIPDRGIWWQIIGFTVVGGGCLAILEVFAGSEFWAFQWFETTVTKLYWAFVIPLAGLFDEARKMFETKMEIRRAARAKALAQEREKGMREGIREGMSRYSNRMAEARLRFGVRDEETGVVTLALTPEVEDFLSGEPDDSAD